MAMEDQVDLHQSFLAVPSNRSTLRSCMASNAASSAGKQRRSLERSTAVCGFKRREPSRPSPAPVHLVCLPS